MTVPVEPSIKTPAWWLPSTSESRSTLRFVSIFFVLRAVGLGVDTKVNADHLAAAGAGVPSARRLPHCEQNRASSGFWCPHSVQNGIEGLP